MVLKNSGIDKSFRLVGKFFGTPFNFRNLATVDTKPLIVDISTATADGIYKIK